MNLDLARVLRLPLVGGAEPALPVVAENLVGRAEFKRKQAAPGLKVTDRAFGTGWRMPIAAKTDL